MNRMKFEGRMNHFMLTAIRSAKNEDGLISDRDLKAIEARPLHIHVRTDLYL